MKGKLGFLIFALIITIAIWFQINLLNEQVDVIHLPLHIVNLPDDLYIFNQGINIPVRVTGKGVNILLYHLSKPAVSFNGSALKLGENVLSIQQIHDLLPVHWQLMFDTDDSIDYVVIRADKISQKRVPVVFDFLSESERTAFINNGYSFDGYFVTISGPEQEILEINHVYTERISSDILRARRRNVRIRTINEHILIIPMVLELHTVSDEVTTRTLSLVPIQHDETRVSIFPQRVTVKVGGSTDALNSLLPDDVVAYIVDDIGEDTTEVEIRFDKPEHIRIIDFTPQRVSVIKQE